MGQTLIEYIQKLLKQGYNVGTIRNTLLNAGYSPYDVDLAIRAAQAPVRRVVPAKTLLVIFVALIVVSVSVLVVLKLLAPKPVELELNLTPLTTTVSPGQALILTAEIINPSGRLTKALVEFSISGPEGLLTTQSAQVTVGAKASLPSTILLPETAKPGFYVLRARLSWDAKLIERIINFEITERLVETPVPAEVLKKEVVERARAVQLVCPAGCDDFNACTKDECIEGTCMHAPITPCCGDGLCESGETALTCSIDCAPREKTPDELILQAKSLAQTNPVQASATCSSIGLRELADECFSAIAGITKNKELCESVVTDSTRDGCYITFAYENDFSVCEKIGNKYTRQACFSLKNLHAYSEAAKT